MTRNELIKGTFLIAASSLAYAGMSVFVKQVTAMGVDSYKTTLFRMVIGLALLSTAALFGKVRLVFNNGWLLFVRGMIGGCCVFIFFLTISKIGIAKGTVLMFTSTIFATLFSALLLKEHISPLKWLAVLIAMGGIYLVATSRESDVAWTSFGWYELLGIVGGVLSGMIKCIIKKLHATDTSYTIFFALCAGGIWIVIVPANLVPCDIGYLGGVFLLGIGALGAVGQLFCTEGYRHLPVSLAALMELSFPVFNLIVGVLMYREPVTPAGLIGCSMILLSSAVVIQMNRRSAVPASASRV